MIIAAAVCPHPPLLFRDLTGREDVAAELRRACVSVVAELVGTGPDRLAVLGGTGSAGGHASQPPVDQSEIDRCDDHADFGVTSLPRPHAGATRGPLSLRAGRLLIAEAGWTGPLSVQSIAWDSTPGEVAAAGARWAGLPDRVALLAMGDGSALRDQGPPGDLDERALGFDRALGDALRNGDPQALAGLDAGLADELMAAGRAPLGVLGTAVAAEAAVAEQTRVSAEVSYEGDPFGVTYFVALWRIRHDLGAAG